MKKRNIIIWIFVILAIALICGCLYFYNSISTVANSKDICQGVHIDGINVGGLTKDEAYEVVSEEEDKLKDKKVTITYENHKDTVALSEFGYSYSDVSKACKAAYDIGKKGSMWQRYKAIKAGAGHGENITIEKAISEESFQEYVDKHADEFVKVAKNASLTRENGQFVITDEQNGMEVPVKDNAEALNKQLNDSWDKEDFEYELTVNVAEPEYKREDMEKVKDVLGTYTTTFATSTFNRITNIKNACSKINGTLLYPGDEFSTMDLIAPLSADNGYLTAGSYSSGEVIETYGGGVCQVSTTLYNSVLLSELEVTERNNHQMVVSYVKAAMDAAVSDSGGQDFKFVNSLENPVYIEGYVEGYSITFTIYGVETRAENRRIEYVSETIQTIQPGKDIVTKDKNMEEGKENVTQSAHVGCRAKLWKNVYVDDVLESTTEVNSSYYAPSARRVTVGTKKKEKEEKKDNKNSKNNNKDNKDSKDVKPDEAAEDSQVEEPEVTEAVQSTEEEPATEAVQ